MLPVVFLVASLACALIGRILLVTTALGVSTGWGFTVLLVPLGPLFFRLKHKEKAAPTRYWRMATALLFVLFLVNGGNLSSVTSLIQPEQLAAAKEVASAGDTHFHLPDPGKIIASLTHSKPTTAEAKPATPGPAVASPTNATTATSATPSPAIPSATPSKAVAASTAAMPPAPKVLTVAERTDANRKEFERLTEWYENLRREKGYLKKGDNAAVDAYNAEAAKYQAALQLAKVEQAEIAKLTATARK